jgi:hypothetical protein
LAPVISLTKWTYCSPVSFICCIEKRLNKEFILRWH